MAMSMFREQVADALRAVRVTSPTSFSWFGRSAAALLPSVRKEIDDATARDYLVARVARELYTSFYIRGAPFPHDPFDALPPGADPAFVASLSAANAGKGGPGGAWRTVEVARDGAVLAERDGLRVRIDARDLDLDDGRPPAPGSSVGTRLPSELRGASPGFYLALGDAAGALDETATELRVYFSIARAGAVPLLAAATRVLNEEQLAFSIKVVDHPVRYGRCDTAVLYLDEGSFARARGPLRAIVRACQPHLRPSTPALTKPLVHGVGLGEHLPALGTSFGSGRCRLIAEGIADAREQRLTALGDRVEAVANRFALAGMDLDVPYLVTAGGDDYVL
jgi:hypothetical protein